MAGEVRCCGLHAANASEILALDNAAKLKIPLIRQICFALNFTPKQLETGPFAHLCVKNLQF